MRRYLRGPDRKSIQKPTVMAMENQMLVAGGSREMEMGEKNSKQSRAYKGWYIQLGQPKGTGFLLEGAGSHNRNN